jgi:ATP-dependent RNA helicase HelY
MAGTRYRYPRSRGKYKDNRSATHKKLFYEDCRVDPALKNSFSKIGKPGLTPFKPDPFQLEALERIKDGDVLVSAPTGSGKTWIAIQAIKSNLKHSLRTWYASPLKALSNSLYQEFSNEFGSDSCGILTGERKENTDAPVIVGTTEILRNQLYDNMHEGTSLNSDLVILDEAHYLSDPDRGVVWEEVLIYLPPRVKLLLLSATVSNSEEVCGWLMQNRKTKAYVVKAEERPVPLETLFLFPDGLIAPLSGRKGLSPKVKKFVQSGQPRGRNRRQDRPGYDSIISCLRKQNLLPAIFFLKSRMECDNALAMCSYMYIRDERKSELKEEVNNFLSEYPHLENHRHLNSLMNTLAASHHAGHLPYWKVLIEKMMNKGYLDAIFSTSTVAAGVNFPARTVVLVQSDKFNGHTFADLTSTELHQMTGRAGRRGMDNIGFVVVVPGIHQDPQLIHDLSNSNPEPLVSQIRINFSMVLNLLLSHTPGDIRTLLELSFARYHQRGDDTWMQRYLDDILKTLSALLPDSNCDNSDPFEVTELIDERADLKRRKKRLKKEPRRDIFINSLKPLLERGRVFRNRSGVDLILFHRIMYRGRILCFALEIGKMIRVKKAKPRLRRVSIEKIKYLYDRVVDIPDERDIESLQQVVHDLEHEELDILDTDRLIYKNSKDALNEIDYDMNKLPCIGCRSLPACNPGRNKPLREALSNFKSVSHMIDNVGETLWISFKRHLRFLKKTGFVDESGRLTQDGIWASKLRLDQPLLIAEAIKNEGFRDASPEVLAGLIALFVWDRTQEVDTRLSSLEDLDIMIDAFDRLIGSMEDIMLLMDRKSFHYPQIMFWPGAALFQWTKGISWEALLKCIPVGEGDMASLIVRTADHLRQVLNLRETHPVLAQTAREAIDLILREPVFLP